MVAIRPRTREGRVGLLEFACLRGLVWVAWRLWASSMRQLNRMERLTTAELKRFTDSQQLNVAFSAWARLSYDARHMQAVEDSVRSKFADGSEGSKFPQLLQLLQQGGRSLLAQPEAQGHQAQGHQPQDGAEEDETTEPMDGGEISFRMPVSQGGSCIRSGDSTGSHGFSARSGGDLSDWGSRSPAAKSFRIGPRSPQWSPLTGKRDHRIGGGLPLSSPLLRQRCIEENLPFNNRLPRWGTEPLLEEDARIQYAADHDNYGSAKSKASSLAALDESLKGISLISDTDECIDGVAVFREAEQALRDALNELSQARSDAFRTEARCNAQLRTLESEHAQVQDSLKDELDAKQQKMLMLSDELDEERQFAEAECQCLIELRSRSELREDEQVQRGRRGAPDSSRERLMPGLKAMTSPASRRTIPANAPAKVISRGNSRSTLGGAPTTSPAPASPAGSRPGSVTKARPTARSTTNGFVFSSRSPPRVASSPSTRGVGPVVTRASKGGSVSSRNASISPPPQCFDQQFPRRAMPMATSGDGRAYPQSNSPSPTRSVHSGPPAPALCSYQGSRSSTPISRAPFSRDSSVSKSTSPLRTRQPPQQIPPRQGISFHSGPLIPAATVQQGPAGQGIVWPPGARNQSPSSRSTVPAVPQQRQVVVGFMSAPDVGQNRVNAARMSPTVRR